MKKLLFALTAALLSVASAASAQALHPLITGKPLAWLKTPNGDQMAAAYARKAHRAKVGGWAILECQVETNGDLKACQVLGDGPVNIGVGEAALSLAQYFRLDVANIDPGQLPGGVMTIPIIFYGGPASPLTNTLAGSPSLLLTPDAKGPIACPTDDAPKRTCRSHNFYWADRPSMTETVPFIRAAAAEPATTSVLCSVAKDMRLTACSQAGPADPSQLKAMNGLLPRFTVPAQASDNTPTRDGLIYVQFDWPALRRAIDTSVLTKTP